MKEHRPPAIPAWLLKYLLSSENKEPLAGDLLEEFQNGRSAGWYWRQAVSAMALSLAANVRSRWGVVFFAVLWTVPLPAWLLYTDLLMAHGKFMGRVWSLDWPYSSICGFLLPLGLNLLPVWLGGAVGITAYLLLTPPARPNFRWRNTARGFIVSVMMFVIVSIFSWIGAWTFRAGHPFGLRHVGYIGMIEDPQLILFRLPFFFSLLASMWEAMPLAKTSMTKPAA